MQRDESNVEEPRQRPPKASEREPALFGQSSGPVDILVEAGNPEQLDRDVQALPGCQAAVVGGPLGPFPRVDGAFVVRCFTGTSALKFMLEHQGYGNVVRELDELL